MVYKSRKEQPDKLINGVKAGKGGVQYDKKNFNFGNMTACKSSQADS